MISSDYENGGIYRALAIYDDHDFYIYIPGYHSYDILDENKNLCIKTELLKHMFPKAIYCMPNSEVLKFNKITHCWVTFENGDLNHPILMGLFPSNTIIQNTYIDDTEDNEDTEDTEDTPVDITDDKNYDPDNDKRILVPLSDNAVTTISDNGIRFIKTLEGLRLEAYWDRNAWAIGYGHRNGVTEGMTCTEDEANAWLDQDIDRYENAVNTYVTNFTLTQNRFDALVSFTFNLGVSNLQYLIRDGRSAEEVQASIPSYYHAGGDEDVELGLKKRRKGEQYIFVSGYYIYDPWNITLNESDYD